MLPEHLPDHPPVVSPSGTAQSVQQKRQHSQTAIPPTLKRTAHHLAGAVDPEQPPVPVSVSRKPHRLYTRRLWAPPADGTPTPSAYNPLVPRLPGMSKPTVQGQEPFQVESGGLDELASSPSGGSLTPAANPVAPMAAISKFPEGTVQPDVGNVAGDAVATAPVAAAAVPNRQISEEDQQLARKLKETYKNIIRLEEECQKGCHEINTKLYHHHQDSNPNILQDLWRLYHTNVSLLDNYYDFLLCALRPLLLKTGKQIVNVYKIPRRLWVYGIVGCLEVLKNVVNLFMEHEICACFIAYSFNILSSLTDLLLDMQGWWAEKLGDLSRMAIALYPLRFIDWKISSEYWYALAMRLQFGHGKIYYHMLTVQQDNLEALVNIGKLVTCRDPFVPTGQYLRLVVENICNQRHILNTVELPIIDFIKIHKILLMATYHESGDMQALVTRYLKNFGVNQTGLNFFKNPNALTVEKLNFWFQKGLHFAVSNISHLIGFGDVRNPFARLFELTEAIKERRDKKDRKRRALGQEGADQPAEELGPVSAAAAAAAAAASGGASPAPAQQPSDLTLQQLLPDPLGQIPAAELKPHQWAEALQHVNRGVVELSLRMLKDYLVGPTLASTLHIIVWIYFLLALGRALAKYPLSVPVVEWFVTRCFPWYAFVNYLNDLLYDVQHKLGLMELVNHYLYNPEVCASGSYINYFNKHEQLPEVFKCWGTLWFDFIESKGDYNLYTDAGIDKDIFDLPIGGSEFKPEEEPERLVRILLLARTLADKYSFGLCRDEHGFRFDASCYERQAEAEQRFPELVQFLQDLRIGQLPTQRVEEQLLLHATTRAVAHEVDEAWFKDSLRATLDDYSDEMMYELLNGTNDMYGDGDEDADIDDEDETEGGGVLEGGAVLELAVAPMKPLDMVLVDMSEPGGAGGLQGPLPVDGDLGPWMDTAYTHIVLDTNMWLKYCGRMFKCMRSGVFRAAIPLTVFQELRLLRRSQDLGVADAATRAVITVRELNRDERVMPLRFDGTTALLLNEIAEFESNLHWRNSMPTLVINAVKQYDDMSRALLRAAQVRSNKTGAALLRQDASQVRYCVLVTEDRSLRARARSFGATSHLGSWLLSQIEHASKGRCTD